MKHWAIIVSGYKDEGIIVNFSEYIYTSLKAACEAHGINYSSASKGKRRFNIDNDIVLLHEVEVVKIKGRENNYKRKKK